MEFHPIHPGRGGTLEQGKIKRQFVKARIAPVVADCKITISCRIIVERRQAADERAVEARFVRHDLLADIIEDDMFRSGSGSMKAGSRNGEGEGGGSDYLHRVIMSASIYS